MAAAQTSKNQQPSNVVSPPAAGTYRKTDATQKLPVEQQAVIVLNLFEKSKTVEEFKLASLKWSNVRPLLVIYETKNECSRTDADVYIEMGKSIIKDLFETPWVLLLAVAELLFHISIDDRTNALKDVKEVWSELKDYAADEAKKKGKEISKEAIEKLAKKLREALAKYLGGLVKSNSKQLTKVVAGISGVMKAYSAGIGAGMTVAFTPLEISGEWCGLLQNVDDAQASAFRRIFPKPSQTSSMAPAPSSQPKGPTIRLP